MHNYNIHSHNPLSVNHSRWTHSLFQILLLHREVPNKGSIN